MSPTTIRLTARALALSSAAALAPAAAGPAYEGFSDYSIGANVWGLNGGTGWGGTGWGGDWWDGRLDLQVTAPGLTYAGLPTTPGAATAAGAPATPPPSGTWVAWYTRLLSAPVGLDNSTLYLSFLLRPELGQPLSDYGGLNIGDLFIGKSGINGGSDPRYGLEGPTDSVAPSGVAASPGETVLLVLKASFLPGNDRFDLFVNPLPGWLEPTTADATKLNRDLGITTFIAVNNAGNWTIDEIRIGDSFATVSGAPAPGVPALLLGGLGVLAARRGRGRS